MSSDTVWELEPHTKAKHEILVTYLQAWFGIMGGTAFEKRALVFDGFAGPGIYRGGQLHPTYISGIERGERNVSLVNIRALAVALEVSVGELFD